MSDTHSSEAATFHRWIPTSDRLPAVGEHVLACWCLRKVCMNAAVRRVLNGKAVWSNVDGWAEIAAPIAWMPLPEPPEAK